MQEFSEIYSLWAEVTVAALKERYERSGLRASGKYAEALEWQVKFGAQDNIKILGAPHSRYMQDGRRPNRRKTMGQIMFLKDIIAKWIEDKRLSFDNPKRASFLIARKIVMEGITVPNQYNDGQVVSGVFTSERIGDLTSRLAGAARTSITSELKTALKNIA